MGKLILFHGSPNERIVPTYGLGNEKHDYGKGFYLTENIELAKEWAVCRPNEANSLSMKDPGRLDRTRWRGQNLLGYALMMVRDKLREV